MTIGDLVTRSPVLLITFNRPDFASETAQAIVDQRPSALYVACDGPRHEEERAAVERTRETVLDLAGDRVETRTLFQDRNLGCKGGVETAISWFFEHEPEGIVLEDDCVP